MTPPDPRFEDQVRAMLQRRADDVRPVPPRWEELMGERRWAATVLKLEHKPDDRRASGRARSPMGLGSRARPLAAVAAALLVLVAGVTLVERGRGKGSEGVPAAGEDAGMDNAAPPQPDHAGGDTWPGGHIATAGTDDFRIESAAPIFPVRDLDDLTVEDLERLSDPNEVVMQYIDTVGLTDAPDYRVDLAQDDNGQTQPDAMFTAGVAWSTLDAEGSRMATGVISLRKIWDYELLPDDELVHDLEALDDGFGNDVTGWVVVGAYTSGGPKVVSVNRSSGTLAFAVDRRADRSGVAEVVVEVEGPDGILHQILAPNDVPPGELRAFEENVPDDQPVVIRVQHLNPGPISVNETTIPGIHP